MVQAKSSIDDSVGPTGAPPPDPVLGVDASASVVDLLTGLWERALGRSPISANTSFFDLDGSYPIATELFINLKDAAGWHLSADTMFLTPTIGTMARAMDGDGFPPLSSIAHVKSGQSGPPLFFIPGACGGILQFAPTASRIDVPIPVYGIRPRGVDGVDPLTSIGEMAQHCIDQITRIWPDGPYLLVGYSVGGLVAFEIARRLSAAGKSVPLLAVLDTYPPESNWSLGSHLAVLASRLIYRICRLRNYSLRELGPHLVGRIRGLFGYLSRGVTPASYRAEIPAFLPPAIQRVYAAGVSAAMTYRPSFYDGKLVFFQPTERGLEPSDPRQVWRHFVKDIEIHKIPGNHVGLINLYPTILATLLSHCLGKIVADQLPRPDAHTASNSGRSVNSA